MKKNGNYKNVQIISDKKGDTLTMVWKTIFFIFCIQNVHAQTQDLGNKFLKASTASVINQFLTMPLPMTHYIDKNYQFGIAVGKGNVDSKIIQLKGPLASISYSKAFRHGIGLYALGFYNSSKVTGGGNASFVTPWFGSGLTPLDIGAAGQDNVNISNVTGKMIQ